MKKTFDIFSCTSRNHWLKFTKGNFILLYFLVIQDSTIAEWFRHI